MVLSLWPARQEECRALSLDRAHPQRLVGKPKGIGMSGLPDQSQENVLLTHQRIQVNRFQDPKTMKRGANLRLQKK